MSIMGSQYFMEVLRYLGESWTVLEVLVCFYMSPGVLVVLRSFSHHHEGEETGVARRGNRNNFTSLLD